MISGGLDVKALGGRVRYDLSIQVCVSGSWNNLMTRFCAGVTAERRKRKQLMGPNKYLKQCSHRWTARPRVSDNPGHSMPYQIPLGRSRGLVWGVL